MGDERGRLRILKALLFTAVNSVLATKVCGGRQSCTIGAKRVGLQAERLA